MNDLLKDVRSGLRSLGKQPGYTAIALITLALGIGVNTAIFSVVDAALLQPLPFPDPDRLAMAWSSNQQRGVQRGEVSLDDYLDWRKRSQAFEELATFGPWGFNITGENEPEKITAVVVSPNFLKTLGVVPVLGRGLLDEEAAPGRDQVVLMGYDLWQRRYGKDPSLVGRTLTLDGKTYTVVGITPPDFHFPNAEVEMWAPLSLVPDESSRRSRWLKVIGRLKTGVTGAQANGELSTIAGQLAQEYSETNRGWSAAVTPLREVVVKDARRALLLLLSAVGFVMLIACVNIANLTLSRVESRQREMAVRAALGAGRARLVRLLITESVLLSFIGGVIGFVLAFRGFELLASFIPTGPAPGPDDLSLLRFNQISADVRVFAFALLLSLLSGVVSGMIPAIRASRLNLNESLKDSRTFVSRSRWPLRNALVVTEVALTSVLLVGAGLLVRSFTRLMQEQPGFQSGGLLTFRISPSSKYRQPTQRLDYYQRLIENLKTLPEVQAVGATTSLPFSGTDLNTPFSIEGRADLAAAERSNARFHSITAGYLEAMAIPLVQGRSFNEFDNGASHPVALINETMAKRYWPGEDALGQRLKLSFGGDKSWEIIGVVRDTRQDGLEHEVKPEIYLPTSQRPWFFMTVVVRTNGDPAGIASVVRKCVWAIDNDIPIYRVATMDQRLSESIAKRRFNMLIVGAFALLGLALAATGIYGVISYSVTRRTHEIGIRMAVGAQSFDVLKLVVGQGIVLIGLGLLLGMMGAFALTRLMANLLFGVTATDPTTFIGVTFLLLIVALLACYIPARRATKVDPLVALRYE